MTKKALIEVWALLTSQNRDHFRGMTEDQCAQEFEIYELCLGDLDDDLLRAAALNHICTNKWFPKVAELREAYFALSEHGLPSSEEAWTEVTGEMRRVGYYGDPRFSIDQIYDAVNTFGWENMCSSEDHTALRAHFYRTYESIMKRRQAETRMLPEVRDRVKMIHGARGPQKVLTGGFRKAVG